MRILAVDTATPRGSVALLESGRLVGEINYEVPGSHSSRLLQSIDFLLGAAGLSVREIDGFGVAAGPGSFTGIRIGLSTVKSLAFASGKPAAPVSTLTALATKLAHSPARLICPLLDAKKAQIYAALFELRPSGLAEIIPQGAYNPDGFFSRLPARRLVRFIGDGLALYGDAARAILGDKARFSFRSSFLAAEVGTLADRILREGEGVPAERLEPLYFRRSQAEEKRAR